MNTTQQKHKSAWRFWNTKLLQMEYGLGQERRRYEDESFIAMRRIKAADEWGGELFDGDLIHLDRDGLLYRVNADGLLQRAGGEPCQLARSSRYVVVAQDPYGTFDRAN